MFIELSINYTLRRNARSKHVRIVVKNDGTCVISAPKRVPVTEIDRLVQKRSAWILDTIEKVKKNPRPYSFIGTSAELKKYKSSALRLVKDRLEFYNTLYGFTWSAVSIRNQKTRWGSCSSTGRLSFTYKLCLLPPELADYVIVHELCHLGEMNHSPRFWKLVARALPEYRDLKRALNYGTQAKS